MLDIKNLTVKLDNNKKTILHDINLKFAQGSVTYLLGPNGAGKSALLHTVMGNPKFKVAKGQILYSAGASGKIKEPVDLVSLEPSERAKLGIFLSWQEPVGIPGLSTFKYLFYTYKAIHNKSDLTEEQFTKILDKFLINLNIAKKILEKDLFIGLSGGEKKRLEVLSMFLLEPKLIMLDELDSGLDIDSERFLFTKILEYKKQHNATLIIVSHGFRVTEYIKPKHVAIINKGKLQATGDIELLTKVQQFGFDNV